LSKQQHKRLGIEDEVGWPPMKKYLGEGGRREEQKPKRKPRKIGPFV